jgi:hypothetical protein
MGSIRTVTRNIKRWRGAEMVRRWTALGVTRAEQRFRRIKGHRDLHLLVQALKLETPAIDNHHVAA